MLRITTLTLSLLLAVGCNQQVEKELAEAADAAVDPNQPAENKRDELADVLDESADALKDPERVEFEDELGRQLQELDTAVKSLQRQISEKGNEVEKQAIADLEELTAGLDDLDDELTRIKLPGTQDWKEAGEDLQNGVEALNEETTELAEAVDAELNELGD